MELKVIEESESLSYVALKGRLDLEGVMGIETKFLQHTTSRKQPTLVDMSEVEFMASLGIRMLLSCAKSLHSHQAKLVLLNPQPLVASVLDSMGLDDILLVTNDEAEARKLLQR